MNQLQAIRDAGKRAAAAVHKGDHSLSRRLSEWARRAIRMEDDQRAADKAYRDAYAEEAEQYHAMEG